MAKVFKEQPYKKGEMNYLSEEKVLTAKSLYEQANAEYMEAIKQDPIKNVNEKCIRIFESLDEPQEDSDEVKQVKELIGHQYDEVVNNFKVAEEKFNSVDVTMIQYY
ncbi:hypothetical protein PIROE2DRAFT_61554 [Piromyces sp. E2]|nr:hypothetical protein PIROE2DRAFT_61554 [Piromyces sp. E2]|eukprot:OUM62973.1 hypothetical protein PIROE2DRAFT_61554 [Piromyces sp. E2]